MELKLTISDPKTGKSVKRDLKDGKAFLGMRIKEIFKGETIDLQGYEFEITGGSDKCGFPMRYGINTPRKKIFAKGGTGLHLKRKGMNKRKTVCGDKINETISQVNLKVLKMGKDNLFVSKEEAKPEAPKEGKKPAEAPKAEPVKEAPKAPKAEEKKEEKPAEPKKEEAKPEEKKE